MSQCLKPTCLHLNPIHHNFCEKCGTKLLLVERYRAKRVLGQGGFGRTFLAIDELKPSHPPCVIKQLLPQAQGTNNAEKAAELFEQEAEQLEKLGKHPQVPELFAYFTQDEYQYLVQEYIAGRTLAQELKKQNKFNEQQICKLLGNMFNVLKFVHSNNVIHRDIKPENIICRHSDKKLVLVDFGAAKVNVDRNVSITGTIIGSAGYTAPEQGKGRATFASDLYSLGVTCIHLLTNVKTTDLFDDYEGEWIWRDHLKDNKVSDNLARVLDKLIERTIKKRYQSLEEVLISIKSKPSPPKLTPPKQKITSSLNKTQLKQELLSLSPNEPKAQFQQEISPPANEPKTQFQQITQPKEVTFEFVTITVKKKLFGGTNLNYQVSQGKAKSFTINLGKGVTLDLIIIPGGKFLMGSLENEEKSQEIENPQHWVTVPSFTIGKYPITQAQWQVIMGNNPSHFKDNNPSASKGKKRPVETVSWYDCVEFCEKISYLTGKEFRLPSEAEWEYACRAMPSPRNPQDEDIVYTPFHCGETITTELANYNGQFTYGAAPKGKNQQETTEVGSFPPNAFGLYDMHGNILEWCADTWHDNYKGAPTDGSAWLEGGDKHSSPLRGGAWSSSPDICRSACRSKLLREASELNYSRHFKSGFRVVYTPSSLDITNP